MKKLTPYQRIMRASEKGVGVRLSAEECIQMSTDSAIFMLAENDDDGLEEPPRWEFDQEL